MSKGYTEIKLATEEKVTKDIEKKMGEESKDEEEFKEPKSKLPAQLQKFINFIFDHKMMEQSVVKVGYDIKRLPLGQLSNETAMNGYRVLRDIESALKTGKGDLAALSSQFYTYIPHAVGMQKMSNFIINSEEKLRQKLDLIQNLVDI